MPNIKKLLLSLSSSVILLMNVATPVFASWYNQTPGEYYGKVFGSPENEIFGERYTFANVDWIIWSVVAWPFAKIVGDDFFKCIFNSAANSCLNTLLTSEQTTGYVASDNTDTNLVSLIFEPRPLSGITYITSAISEFNLIAPAQAQTGFGYSKALTPILGLWRPVRDMAYTLFVLIAIVFSFMIMFRVKISPQVIISIQSALPKLFIAIVAATFSYAIAGLLVDLMYVFIGLISLMFGSFWGNDPIRLFEFFTKGDFFGVEAGIYGLIPIYLILFVVVALISFFMVFGLIGAGLTIGAVGVVGPTLTALTGGLGSLTIFLILFVVIVALMMFTVKTIFSLIKAYVNVLLLTVFAPLQIAFGALISTSGIGQWVRSLASNLSVFVVTGVLFFFSFFFMGFSLQLIVQQLNSGGLGFEEVVTKLMFGYPIANLALGEFSAEWPPLLAGASGTPILFLGASFVIFTMIPKASELIKSIIEGKPFAYGSAISEAVVTPYKYTEGLPLFQNLKRYKSGETSADFLTHTKLGRKMAEVGKINPQDLKDYFNKKKDFGG